MTRTKILWWLATLMLLGGAVGCASDEEKVQQFLAEAEIRNEAGEHREALLLLRQALQIDPTNASINIELAETLGAMDLPGDASFFYGEAYRLDPTLTDAALKRVPLLYADERDEARTLVEDVLERDPDSHMAYLRLAEIELLEGDTEAALSAALTSVELAPNSPESHRIVGTVYQTKARERRVQEQEVDESLYESALEAYRRADALESAWYHRNDIARLYSQWPGHAAEAKEAWERAFAAAQDADEREGMQSIAVVALRWARSRRDLAFMEWALRRQLEIEPTALRIWRQLAAVAGAQEEGGGDAVWKEALERRPDDSLVHAAYASHLAEKGRERATVEYLESLPPDIAADPEIRLLLVKVYSARGRVEDARAMVEQMRESVPQDPRTEFAAARLALAEGRRDESAEQLRQLADRLERVDLFRLLSEVELARRDYGAALDAANKAIQLHPTGTRQLLSLRHRAQIGLGDWTALLNSLRRMPRQGMPLQASDALLVARAHYELGDSERGREILERLLSVDEPSLRAVLAFARFEGRRQPERAQKILEAAMKRVGSNSALVHVSAQLALMQGRPQEALERIDRRDASESLAPQLRLLRARTLGALERWAEAEADARAAFEATNAPPSSARVLARILRARGDEEEAIAALERARAERRLSGRNLWLLGRMYLDQGDLPKARVILEEALGSAPNFYLVHNDLAYVLAETGENLDRALALARQARSAMSESPAVADTLGLVYLRRGMLRPATEEFRTALEMGGEGGDEELLADIHYHLGLALREQGRHDDALQEIDQALELRPEHPKARALQAELAAASLSADEG